MQFHQNQCVSANVSPLVKWHLLTEKCFVGKFRTGSCREQPPAAAGREEQGVSPAPGLQLLQRRGAPGRTFQMELLWLEIRCQEIRCQETSTRALPAAAGPRCPHTAQGRQPVELSPCPSTALDRAPRHGSKCHPGTASTAVCFPLADEGGNVSHSYQVIHCPGPMLNPPSSPSESAGRIQSLPSYFYKACSIVRKERVPSG